MSHLFDGFGEGDDAPVYIKKPDNVEKPQPPQYFKDDEERKIESANVEAEQIMAACYFNEKDIAPWTGTNHPIFKEWEDIATDIVYSRPSYHFANMLSLLSVTLNRKVAVKIAFDKIYPSVYVADIGVTTISGKSWSFTTLINRVKDVIIREQLPIDTEGKHWKEVKQEKDDAAKVGNNVYGIKLLQQMHTNANFCQEIAKVHNILWYYNEAREFFTDADSNNGFNKNIINNLCGAYDGGVVERGLSKRNKGDETNESETKEPFISLNFNMTVKQLKECCSGSLFSSGFAPRFMWFIETGGKMEKNRTATPAQEARANALKIRIKEISDKLFHLQNDSIIFNVSDDIEEWKLKMSDKYGSDDDYQAIIGRGFAHVYKMAMIFTIYDETLINEILSKKPTATNPVILNLPKRWVDEAIRIYESYLLPRMARVLDMSKMEDKKNRQLFVLGKLKELNGVTTISKLLRATAYNEKDLNSALVSLQRAGQIVITKKRDKGVDGKLKSGPATKYICLVSEEKVDAIGKVMDIHEMNEEDKKNNPK
jgi:hypothetical protein